MPFSILLFVRSLTVYSSVHSSSTLSSSSLPPNMVTISISSLASWASPSGPLDRSSLLLYNSTSSWFLSNRTLPHTKGPRAKAEADTCHILIHKSFIPSAHPLETNRLVFGLIMFHFIKREYETVFVHRFSNATMPLRNLPKKSVSFPFPCRRALCSCRVSELMLIFSSVLAFALPVVFIIGVWQGYC